MSFFRKVIAALIICAAVFSSLLFYSFKTSVKDSGGDFAIKAAQLYAKYDKDISKDDKNNPYALKRIAATEYNGKKYGAAEVIYDKKNDFALLQYNSEEEVKQALMKMEGDGVIAELDGFAELCETEKGTFCPEASEVLGTPKYISKINMKTDNVLVAVIDTGVMYDHPKIANRFYSKGTDLTSDACDDAYYDTTLSGDYYGHATAVSGIIADNTPDNVKIINYKVVAFGSSLVTASAIITAINSAVNEGAAVINMSLSTTQLKTSFQNSIKNAIKKGVCVCASAGNQSSEISGLYPASTEGTITVSALEESNSEFASFSNYGDCVDFCAPGRRIRSTYPTSNGGSFATLSGTSFSSPYIASLCANLKSIKSDLSKDDIYKTLCEFSTDLGEEGFDKYYGNGLPDISDITYSNGNAYTFSIPDGVLSVNEAFDYEKNTAPWSRFADRLIEVNVNSNLESIGNYMFYNMPNAVFNMPNTYKSVGDYAFYNCKSISSMTFNINVSYIGSKAFDGIEGFEVSGYRNTPAEQYALTENIDFKILGCNHNYSGEVFEPTSKRDGYTLYTCLICDDNYIGAYKVPKIIDEGTCGYGVKFKLYESGRLVLYNNGRMYDYSQKVSPFYKYRDIIKILEIGDGISSISPYAFYGCSYISQIVCSNNSISMRTDGTGLYTLDNKLVLIGAKSSYIIPENITSLDSTSLILLNNTVIKSNSRFTVKDKFIYDSKGNIAAVFPSYNEKTLRLDDEVKINSNAFILTPYPDTVDTKMLNVNADNTSIGYYFNAANGIVMKRDLTFKIGNSCGLYTYAVNNGFTIENYDLGEAGKSISWYFDKQDNSLNFVGKGDMYTFESENDVPWQSFNIDVEIINIDDRITYISPYAFAGAIDLKEINMPLSVKAFESDTTFGDSYSIETINLTLGSGYSDDYVADDGTQLYQNTPWYISRKTISSFSIDRRVKYIGKEMFRNSIFIRNLTFDEIEEIAPYAFVACTNLSKITNYSKTTVYGEYSVFSHTIGGKPGVYSKRTIEAYSDSTSKDYCVQYGINLLSLGCAHSREISFISSEPRTCCIADEHYLCSDCQTEFVTETVYGNGHNLNLSFVTTTGYSVKNAEVLLNGVSKGFTDSSGKIFISGVPCGNYTVSLSYNSIDIFSESITIDRSDAEYSFNVRYADFVKDGVINAKDYAYALKHNLGGGELFDWGIIEQ